jgi:hypothetical protein
MQDAEAAEAVEGRMVDVQHDQVAVRVTDQASPDGRRLCQRDAEALQLGPDHGQGGIVGTVKHPQGVELGLWGDLPAVAAVGAPRRGHAGTAHGMMPQRLDHCRSQAGLVEVACHPQLELDTPGLLRGVKKMNSLIDDRERQTGKSSGTAAGTSPSAVLVACKSKAKK